MVRAALRVVLTWVVLVGGYYFIPPVERHNSVGEIITLGIGLLVATAIGLDQARRVVHAQLPGVRVQKR